MDDPAVELELLFIDDLIEEMFDALEGKEHHCEFDGVKPYKEKTDVIAVRLQHIKLLWDILLNV